jgi:hypothetical protein
MLFDDPASLEPDDVLAWFNLCSAGLAREEKEAHRLLGAEIDAAQLTQLFSAFGIGASGEEIGEYFMACRRELELSAVFTLTASAEARIRLDAGLRIEANKDDLAQRLSRLRSAVRTDWRIPLYEEGIVEAWKTYIGSLSDLQKLDRARLLTAIGRFRNLLDLRHWVAHGRYWELQRGVEKFPPVDAADMVSELYEALRRAADHRSLMAFA